LLGVRIGKEITVVFLVSGKALASGFSAAREPVASAIPLTLSGMALAAGEELVVFVAKTRG
jgi:hypothetical protein